MKLPIFQLHVSNGGVESVERTDRAVPDDLDTCSHTVPGTLHPEHSQFKYSTDSREKVSLKNMINGSPACFSVAAWHD